LTQQATYLRNNIHKNLPRPIKDAKAVDLDSCFAGAFCTIIDMISTDVLIKVKVKVDTAFLGETTLFPQPRNTAVNTMTH